MHAIFWVYSGFISLLVCCAQIGLGLLQLSSLCGFMLFSGAQYNLDAISRVIFLLFISRLPPVAGADVAFCDT